MRNRLGKLETQVVLDRIRFILEQLPQAIHQAHERIIGERRIANADKILSLYDPDLPVIVRGKAASEIEFGNGLYLSEQSDGLIVDWEFIQEQPTSDSKLVKSSLTRITENYGHPPATRAIAASTPPESRAASRPNQRHLSSLRSRARRKA